MKFFDILKNADDGFKRNLCFFLVAYFCVLLNYPFIRASSTTFFFEAYGAKSSPLAWLWGVSFLSLTVYLSSKLQAKFSVQKVFLFVSMLSAFIFMLGILGFRSGILGFTYLPFVWKEIYIVLQVHLLLAYANNCFKKEDFKFLVGIVGGVGSIGGVLGGWFTSLLAEAYGTPAVMWVGLVLVISPALFFLKTNVLSEATNERSEVPLSSFTPGIGKYIAIIATLVALSQFVINIADFNFHLSFEKSVTESFARTSYLGNIYMITNAVTFILQFLFLPFVMTRVSVRNFHFFIPLSYLLFLLPLVFNAGLHVLAFASFFIYLKASDYSLFSAGKEILYQPLSPNQKYGAKYLTDMLVYRVAKAMIAAVLIYLQSSTILNIMMIVFLLAWISLVIWLFKVHRQLFS